MKTEIRKGLWLKTSIELDRMSKDELFEYIDKLHSTIRNYQIVINVAIDKNENVNGL